MSIAINPKAKQNIHMAAMLIYYIPETFTYIKVTYFSKLCYHTYKDFSNPNATFHKVCRHLPKCHSSICEDDPEFQMILTTPFRMVAVKKRHTRHQLKRLTM
jgi:hypothetical protein